MKVQKSYHKLLKHGMLIMSLILALGLFATTGTAPAYGSTTQYTTTSLTTPAIAAGVSKGYDSVKIAWSAVTGATFYEVYYATSATGTYNKAGTATTTSFTKTGLTTGKTYYFKVRAGVLSGSTNVYSKFSAYKALTPIPATPVAKAISASYTSLKVSWTAVPGATGYKVYRATSSTGTYAYRGATKNLYYTNSSLVTGKNYYYKIIAYRTVNGVNVNSKTAAVVYAKPVPVAPTSAVYTKTATSMKITWTGVSGATKYEIFRATSATGTYSLVNTASSSARSYINTGLTNGKTYYYKVRAYHMEGTTKVNGYCSPVKSLKLGSAYYSGTYKVGRDIPAGEYLLIATSIDAEFFTSTDAAGEEELTYGEPNPRIYETLRTGEYVTLVATKAYPIASAPKVPVNADGSFVPGQYKVGRDISAGTYVINFQDPTDYGILYIESNSYNEYESIIGFDLFKGRIYVTLTAGQYFTFDRGVAYPLATAPALDKTQPTLYDNMYLVGTDIPAGTYTIMAGEGWGYYEIYSDATHSEASYIDYDDLATNREVTVKDGQYLLIVDGYITQQI